MKYEFKAKSVENAVAASLGAPEVKFSASGSVHAPVGSFGGRASISFDLSAPTEVTVHHSCDGRSRIGYEIEANVPLSGSVDDGANCPGSGSFDIFLPAGRGIFSIRARVIDGGIGTKSGSVDFDIG